MSDLRIHDVVGDPRVADALHAIPDEVPEGDDFDIDPAVHREYAYPVSHPQGQFLYMLTRATGATRVVEFATSFGISTIYLAAAMRDNGGGLVIGSEIVPEKVQRARDNVVAAGLESFVDIRQGDARETLGDVGGPVDLVLLDGWPTGSFPSIDRQVLEVLAPQMRVGAVLVDDNGEHDVITYLRDPANGFRSMELPFQERSTELAVKVGD